MELSYRLERQPGEKATEQSVLDSHMLRPFMLICGTGRGQHLVCYVEASCVLALSRLLSSPRLRIILLTMAQQLTAWNWQ